jgi:hypothetical protein
MRLRLYLVIIVQFTVTCLAQNFYQRKDLAFAQVVTGSSIYTQVTVANSGNSDYAGAFFFRKGSGEHWNPSVNDQAIADGKLEFDLLAGETRTFVVTGTDPLQAGTILLFSDDLLPDNFIEGHLTYFFRSGSDITDTVGLGPAQEFYRATLPFENFNEVGLALANGNISFQNFNIVGRRDANVVMRVYGENGNFLANCNDPDLNPLRAMAHKAKFLSQFCPSVTQLSRGRVEILSDVPIYGTALTFLFVGSGTQSSSLPLEPSPTTYRITMISGSRTLAGDIAIWAEGYFVKGYLILDTVNQASVTKRLAIVNGQLIDGALELSFYAKGEAFGFFDSEQEVSLVIEVLSGFDFQSSPIDGQWVMTSLSSPGNTLSGTCQLVKPEQLITSHRRGH